MVDLTLEQLFGQGAIQDASILIIQKSSLPGLTASSSNRAEQLLTALILQAYQHFEGTLTDEQGRIITDEQGRTITYDNRALYEKLNLWFWKRQFIDSFQINTFIVDAFIKPPTEAGALLKADHLNY